MSRSTRQSSSVTKLMATPLRPNRPPRPILFLKLNMINIKTLKRFKLLFGEIQFKLPVDIIFTMVGQIVIDYEGNLLNVNTASKEIGSNQNARRSRSELAHNNVTFLLFHFTVHSRNSEVPLVHFLCKPVDFPACVTEDDGLSNAQCVVQITQRVQLPFFALNLITKTNAIQYWL